MQQTNIDVAVEEIVEFFSDFLKWFAEFVGWEWLEVTARSNIDTLTDDDIRAMSAKGYTIYDGNKRRFVKYEDFMQNADSDHPLVRASRQ